MIKHEFDPNCEDCKPALLDIKTGRPLPKTDPMVVTATEIWEALSLEDKKALNRVWVHNSRDAHDMQTCARYAKAVQKAMENKPL